MKKIFELKSNDDDILSARLDNLIEFVEELEEEMEEANVFLTAVYLRLLEARGHYENFCETYDQIN